MLTVSLHLKKFFFFFELLNWVQLRSIELVGKAEVDKKNPI